MRSLHVMLHVAFLGESDVAHLTLEWLLSSVFDHVDLQSALLVEGLVTLSALERPLTCSNTQAHSLISINRCYPNMFKNSHILCTFLVKILL